MTFSHFTRDPQTIPPSDNRPTIPSPPPEGCTDDEPESGEGSPQDGKDR